MSEFLMSLLVLSVAGGYLGFGALTGVGQRRRGGGALVTFGAVLFFPIYWVGWYVRDTWPSTPRLTRHIRC